ncbi:MAG TPA: prepilin-type N-terminal cleavage/methylation domain-containing protein, partial [Humisphaera sp.]
RRPAPRAADRVRAGVCARGRRGFSLVELLVATAIIGLLVAIVLPGVAAVRERARAAQCVANAGAVGRALIGYAAGPGRGLFPQNESLFGAGRYWYDDARAGQGLGTPDRSWPGKPGGGVLACPADDGGNRSYAMNVWASASVDSYVLKGGAGVLWGLRGVKGPPAGMLLVESWSYFGSESLGYYAPPTVGTAGDTSGRRFGGGGGIVPVSVARPGEVRRVNTEVCFARHRGRASIAYADGHVAASAQADLVDVATGVATGAAAWYPGERP